LALRSLFLLIPLIGYPVEAIKREDFVESFREKGAGPDHFSFDVEALELQIGVLVLGGGEFDHGGRDVHCGQLVAALQGGQKQLDGDVAAAAAHVQHVAVLLPGHSVPVQGQRCCSVPRLQSVRRRVQICLVHLALTLRRKCAKESQYFVHTIL